MKIRWIPEFDYTRAKDQEAPSEKEKTMQRMRIRMQRGNKLMLARPGSESVGLSSGRALGIDRSGTLMLLVLALLVLATTASWAQVISPNLGSVPSGPAKRCFTADA
jgi:hypothetical protein